MIRGLSHSRDLQPPRSEGGFFSLCSTLFNMLGTNSILMGLHTFYGANHGLNVSLLRNSAVSSSTINTSHHLSRVPQIWLI